MNAGHRLYPPVRWAAFALAMALAACSGSNSDTTVIPGGNTTPDNNINANFCAPDNPYAHNSQGQLLSNYKNGTMAREKLWLSDYFQANYLWYQEIPANVDPNAPEYTTGTYLDQMTAYFNALRTPVEMPDGLRKDQFSFLYPTEIYDQMTQSGVVLGYGVEWLIGSLRELPRNIKVGYVIPASQAAQVGLARGDQLVSATIDGVTAGADDQTTAGIAVLNRALRPPEGTGPITLRVRGTNNAERTVRVTPVQTVQKPVLMSTVLPNTGSARVGYVVLLDFILPAEGELFTAFSELASQQVNGLVLDLRYNGGGYIYIASQLGYMIAGPQRTRNRIFERLQYNDKRSADNEDTPFLTTASGLSGSNTVRGTALPTLNLGRVTVLTTDDTCSASEAVINGLRGVGVTVDVVGSTTCGKPYGFTQKNNCGVSYFPIEFQGVNALGQGDYASGMVPSCEANDDLNQPLGSVSEGMLAAALAYRGGTCPALKSADAKIDDSARRVRYPFQEGMLRYPGDFDGAAR